MDNYSNMAMEAAKKVNEMEDEIAMEWFGCSFSDLDEDSRGEVSFEAVERLGIICV